MLFSIVRKQNITSVLICLFHVDNIQKCQPMTLKLFYKNVFENIPTLQFEVNMLMFLAHFLVQRHDKLFKAVHLTK